MLRTLRHGAEVIIGPAVLDSMSLSIASEMMGAQGRTLVARLTAQVLALDLTDRTQTAAATIEWHMPATWVQHWKATVGIRWRLTRWWVRRRPPRMITVTRDVTTSITWTERAGFPHSSIPVDARLGQAVLYAQPAAPATVGKPSTPHYANGRHDPQ